MGRLGADEGAAAFLTSNRPSLRLASARSTAPWRPHDHGPPHLACLDLTLNHSARNR
jgi:hypothetical protein